MYRNLSLDSSTAAVLRITSRRWWCTESLSPLPGAPRGGGMLRHTALAVALAAVAGSLQGCDIPRSPVLLDMYHYTLIHLSLSLYIYIYIYIYPAPVRPIRQPRVPDFRGTGPSMSSTLRGGVPRPPLCQTWRRRERTCDSGAESSVSTSASKCQCQC